MLRVIVTVTESILFSRPTLKEMKMPNQDFLQVFVAAHMIREIWSMKDDTIFRPITWNMSYIFYLWDRSKKYLGCSLRV